MSSLESLGRLKGPDYGGVENDILRALGPRNNVANLLLLW